MTEQRNRCDDITALIDAALEDVLSTGGTQHTNEPCPGQQGDWLDDWWAMDTDSSAALATGEVGRTSDSLFAGAVEEIENWATRVGEWRRNRRR